MLFQLRVANEIFFLRILFPCLLMAFGFVINRDCQKEKNVPVAEIDYDVSQASQ